MGVEASQDKIGVYQNLLKQHEKYKNEVIKLETLLEEKRKGLKEALSELKSLGVDTDNIAAWKASLEAEIEQDILGLQKTLKEIGDSLKNVTSI